MMKELNFAVKIARKAGKYLLENFEKHPKLVKERGLAKEIVTKYDKVSDRIIREELIKKYPYNLLTEESGFTNFNSERTWVVDSLDGSSNFAVGNPFFSVSIALTEKDKIVLGVIYAPFLKELYTVVRGKGAFLNGKRIHVSEVKELRRAYLLSCEGGEKTNKRIAKINSLLHPKVKDMRKLGSGAIEGGFVASGRADAYITTKIYPWDIASAVLLVEEAGGKVTNFQGEEWNLKQSDLILSNGKIHNKILSRIKSI